MGYRTGASRVPFICFRDGAWRITKGTKHGPSPDNPSGKDLEKVAQEDPSYLIWARRDASQGMSDEEFYALSDVMDKYNIPQR